jgi:hypothetical protein
VINRSATLYRPAQRRFISKIARHRLDIVQLE